MPENSSALGAPAPPSYPPPRPTPWERVGSIADAVGTSPVRLVAGGFVAAVLFAVVAWMLAAGPPTSTAGAASSDGAGLPQAQPQPSGSVSGSASASDGGARAVVYVAGAVVRPGVYRLPSDARVTDALDAAGGTHPDADLAALNLAAPVADGERVYVPRKGEPPPPEAAGAAVAAGSPARAAPVNLNTATAEQLDALPGIGPSTAQAILEWRRRHGRFRKVDDLLNVRGIGAAKLEALRPQVRV